MSLASLDIFHVIVALSALLVAAHVGGFLAGRIGIPPMVGELAGGILLGATVFQRIWPEGHAWLLPAAPADPLTEPTSAVLPILGFCSQIGLLMLLFIGGLQLRRLVTRKDAKSVAWISVLGVVIPVAAGLLALSVIDVEQYMGTAASLGALKIVLLIALAITSIPVITRIFLDLGLMNTRLARTVLSVAVLEDVMLYIALSIALGMVNTTGSEDASIPSWLNMAPDSAEFMAWHVGASLLLLAAASWGFGRVTAHREGNAYGGASRLNLIARRSPLGWTLATILIITGVAMLLGLAPMFGALVAGIVASNNRDEVFRKAHQQVEAVGTSFFIPIYFALIGVGLDLVRDIDWQLTLGLLIFGTAVKYSGALLGGIVAGERFAMANALAISVNARGGPGLIVASTAFAAGIIDASAYTSLVILSILTSVGAGVFLAAMLRGNPATAKVIRSEGIDDEPAAAIATPPPPADAQGRPLTPA